MRDGLTWADEYWSGKEHFYSALRSSGPDIAMLILVMHQRAWKLEVADRLSGSHAVQKC